MSRLVLIVLCVVTVRFASAADAPRERISINDNWRFTKGDPNGDSTGLIYDVRPDVKDRRDDKAADSEPTAAEKIAATNRVAIRRVAAVEQRALRSHLLRWRGRGGDCFLSHHERGPQSGRHCDALFWAEVFYVKHETQEEAKIWLAQTDKTYFEEAKQAVLAHGADYKKVIEQIKNKTGLKGKNLSMPLRAVLTGVCFGPELEKIFLLMGKDKLLEKLG